MKRVKETIDGEEYKRFTPFAAEMDEEFNLVDVAAALMNILYNKEVGYDYTDDETGKTEDFVRLFLTVGRIDRLGPKQLLEFFDETAGVSKDDIGDIDILEKFTFVNVSEEAADAIIKKCSGKRLCKRKVKIEEAKKKQQ